MAAVDLPKARRAQQRLHGLGLVPAVLQQQPAAGREARGGLRGDGADILKAVVAAGQGRQRFVRERGQVRVGGGDVGRVAHDQVERAGNAVQPVALDEPHGQAQPPGVGAGDGEGVGAGVHGQHLGLRAPALQGQGDGAAAGAQVRHAGGGRGERQSPVHQRLGIGARVEHAGVHLQRQAVELLGAREIGHGFARRAAGAQGLVAGQDGFGQRIAVVREQPGAVVQGALQQVQQQHLRVDARQALGLRLREGLGDSCY